MAEKKKTPTAEGATRLPVGGELPGSPTLTGGVKVKRGAPQPPAQKQTGKGGGGKGGAKGGKTGFDVGKSEKKGEDVESTIENWWRGILSGEKGSFTKERAQMERQKLYETEKQRERQLLEKANREAVARGIARSGLAARGGREIALETAGRISAGERDIRMQQIMAEWDDKMAALQMAQKALDSRRQYELGKEQIAATREATRARTALGYAQIAAQKEIANRQASIAGASLGLSRERFDFEKQRYQESKIPVPPELESKFPGGMPPGVFDRVFGSGF